jgi:hypothetical protein
MSEAVAQTGLGSGLASKISTEMIFICFKNCSFVTLDARYVLRDCFADESNTYRRAGAAVCI